MPALRSRRESPSFYVRNTVSSGVGFSRFRRSPDRLGVAAPASPVFSRSSLLPTVFGLAWGFSISQFGKVFGDGFSAALYSPGLVVVAAGLITGIAESTGSAARLATKIGGLGSRWIAALLGLFVGLGAVPASGFAMLTSLLPAKDTNSPQQCQTTTATAALSLSAGHGLIVLAPVPIAATAILGADWIRVAMFGVPLALAMAALGAAFVTWLPATKSSPTAASTPTPSAKPSNGSALILLLR